MAHVYPGWLYLKFAPHLSLAARRSSSRAAYSGATRCEKNNDRSATGIGQDEKR